MKLTLTLDYALSPGWLAPYIDGLRAGTAIAARCGACGRVSLPPSRTCRCRSSDAGFVTLPGEATLVSRAAGTDGDFALMRFKGADTLSVVRLEDWGGQTRGRIRPSSGERPALIVGPLKGGAP